MDTPLDLTGLREGLTSPDAARRRDAVEACARLPFSQELAAALRPVAEGDPDIEVRFLARRVIEQIRQREEVRSPEADEGAGADQVFATLAAKFRERLADERPKSRLLALTKVLKYKDHRLLPLVAERLAVEDNPTVLAAMISALGELGDLGHLEALARCLGHPSPRVVANAVTAVARLGGAEVLDLLRPLLRHDDNRVRGNVVLALMPHAPDEAIARLTEMAHSPMTAHRSSALYVLGQVDDPRAISILEAMAASESDEELKEAASELLTRVGPDSLESGTLDRIREDLARPDASVRASAVEEARAHLADAEVRALLQTVAGLDPDELVRTKAASALEEAGPTLDPATSTTIDPDVEAGPTDEPSSTGALGALSRDAAAVAEGAGGDTKERLTRRFRNLLTARNERRRIGAFVKAAKYRNKDLLGLILETLDLETSPRVLVAGLAAVSTLGGQSEVSIVASYLRHGNYRVVVAAVLALFKMLGDDAMSLFLPLLNRSDPRVQTYALIALTRCDRRTLLDYLRTMALSKKDTARTNAVFCLGKVGDPEVDDILLAMVEEETDQALLAQEFACLRQVAAHRTVGPLWALRSRRPNLEIHVRATFDAIAHRTGLTLPQIEEQGQAFALAHPALMAPRPASAEAIMADLEAGPRPAGTPASAPRPAVDPTRTPVVRVAIACLLVGVASVYLLVGPGRDEGPLGTAGSRHVPEHLARIIEDHARKAQIPVRKEVDLDGVTGALDAARLESLAQGFVAPPAPLTGAVKIQFSKDLYQAQGFSSDEFIDLESRGADRDTATLAIAEAKRLVKARDVEAAIRLLADTIATTDPRNLLVLRDLHAELSRVFFLAARLDEARDQALKAQDMAEKIYEIYGRTPLPWAKGRMKASPEEVSRIKAQRAQIEKDYSYAREHRDEITSVDDHVARQREAIRSQIAQARDAGKITAAEYERQVKRLQDPGRQGDGR